MLPHPDALYGPAEANAVTNFSPENILRNVGETISHVYGNVIHPLVFYVAKIATEPPCAGIALGQSGR